MQVNKVHRKSRRKKPHTVKRSSMQGGEGQVGEQVKCGKGGYRKKEEKKAERPPCIIRAI